MRYDPEYGKYFLNSEMILSDEGRRDLDDFHAEWGSGVMRNPMEGLRREMRFNSGSGIKVGPTAYVIGAGVFLGFLGMVVSFMLKRGDIGAFILSGILVLIGLALILSGGQPGSADSHINSKAVHVSAGLVFILAAAAIVYLQINSSYYSAPERFLIYFALAMISVMLLMLIFAIGRFTAPQKVYTEETKATCIGYLRCYDYDKSSRVGHSRRSLINSPLFEYYFEGKFFRSAYDDFDNGPNGKIAVGSQSVIRIDPDHPDHVLGNYKGNGIVFIVMAVICLLMALVPGYILLSGKAGDGVYSESGLAVQRYEYMISDELIDQKIGSDWYIEKIKLGAIEEIKEDGKTYLHFLPDPTFKDVYTTPDFEYGEGDELYVIYQMEDVNGVLKKKPVQFVSAKDTGYSGSHKAYKG